MGGKSLIWSYGVQMGEEDRKIYYEEAMRRGLDSRLQVPFFTTVGKSRVILVDNLTESVKWSEILEVKTPKYNNPRSLYSDDVMDEMVAGTTAIEWVTLLQTSRQL